MRSIPKGRGCHVFFFQMDDLGVPYAWNKRPRIIGSTSLSWSHGPGSSHRSQEMTQKTLAISRAKGRRAGSNLLLRQ